MNEASGNDAAPKIAPVLCVGDALVDLLALVPRLPASGETVWGPPIQRFPGGSGANVASGLARLGVRVAFAGRIGADEEGRFVARDLAERGVDISGLAFDEEVGTGAVVALVEPDGERTFVACSDRAAYTRLSDEDLRHALDPPPSALFVTGLLLLHEPARGAVVRLVERAGRDTPVYFDLNLRTPHGEDAAAVLRAAHAVAEASDVVLASEDEVRDLALKPRAGQLYAVRLGAAGAQLLTEAGRPASSVEGQPIRAVDATGAGDAFDAAFVAARLWGYTPEDALGFANAAAALSVTLPGSRSMPSREEAVRLWRGAGGGGSHEGVEA